MCALSWLITEIILRCTVSTTSKLSQGLSVWDVKLTTHLHLVP